MIQPPTVLQLAVGKPQTLGSEDAIDPMDRLWTTGFFKQPVAGPVALRRLGFDGDGQADLVHHGGPNKAVLCYAEAHYPVWREEFQANPAPGQGIDLQNFGWGGFGENLTMRGLCEETVCLGDVYQVGTARVEVSQPRRPCWKLGRRWRMKELTALTVSTGRTGWYVRVLQEGEVAAGQEMTLLERPWEGWPVARLHRLYYHDRHNLSDAAFLADCPVLSETWRDEFRKRVEKAKR